MCEAVQRFWLFQKFYSHHMSLIVPHYLLCLCLDTCNCFLWLYSRRFLFFILSTPCHLLALSLYTSIHTSLPFSDGRGSGPESKVQVCSSRWWVTERQLFPTVCKYVVSLIECSSTSQQLSFRRACVLVCVCEGERGHSWCVGEHTVIAHLCTQIAHCLNQDAFVIVRKMLPLSVLSHAHTLQRIYHVSIITGCLEAVVWLALLSLH